MENTTVKISHRGVVSVKEVAVRYYTHVQPTQASRSLRKEIRNYPALQQALEGAGWKEKDRFFTPRQLAIVISHLG